MNALEYAAYVRLCLFFVMAGGTLLSATIWLSVYFDYRKNKQK